MPKIKQLAVRTVRQARRLAVMLIGGTVLLVGVAMIVLPGPAVVVIPVGLAILATEFVWARSLLDEVRRRGDDLIHGRRARRDDAKPVD